MINISINLISVATFMTLIFTFSSGVFMVETFRYDGEDKFRYTYLFLLSLVSFGALLTYGFQNA